MLRPEYLRTKFYFPATALPRFVVPLSQVGMPSPFSIPNFRAFWAARFAATVGGMMLVIVIGWQVYAISRETMPPREAAFMLGMIGLAQFLPLFMLTLVVGYVADRIDRRYIARAALALQFSGAAFLGILGLYNATTLPALFIVAVLIGIGRAFSGPSLSALAPNLVPRAMLPTAIAWSSIGMQTGAVVGPPLGAFLFAANSAAPYLTAAVLFASSLFALFQITAVPLPPRSDASPWRATVEGLSYVRRNRIVLGAISLDLFAVLLGGATAMLPVFARDVLHVGVEGLGPLRAAPAVGAAAVALWLTRRPLSRNVGIVMFVCVGVFGLTTIGFGLSRNLIVSLGCLGILGAADMMSVYVRSSLIQLHTPDSMRGRVSAVSMLFISASNELGEFESGLTAAWLGPVEAVVLGGIGAVLVALIWAFLFPELRRADRFVAPEDSPPAAKSAISEEINEAGVTR